MNFNVFFVCQEVNQPKDVLLELRLLQMIVSHLKLVARIEALGAFAEEERPVVEELLEDQHGVASLPEPQEPQERLTASLKALARHGKLHHLRASLQDAILLYTKYIAIP